ncbi:TlpA family protein disulfide reductase [Lacinutrix salivirga]
MKNLNFKNIIFFVIILVLIIPQTRQPIQVALHKGLALFSPSIKTSETLEVVTTYNWKLKTIHGEGYNFNSAKNKVVLVNFWATWCPPCIAEMPSLQALYTDYKDDVEFVFISNEALEVVQTFIEKKDYTFTTVKPLEQPKTEQFSVSGIPRTFLISKTGEIVIDKTGAANWNSEAVRTKIDELLKL